MKQPDRTFFLLGAITLVLSSCGSQAAIQPAATPASSVAPATPSSLPATGDRPTPSEPQIASVSGTLLSPEQTAQLAKLDIEVFLPTYLPPGFQVSGFEAYQRQNLNDRTDSSYYRVSYSGPDNTCIEAGSGYEAMWISNPTITQVETPVGVVKVSSGKYRRSETLQQWAEISQRAEIGQKAAGQAIFTGGAVAAQSCNPVSIAEYTKVLKSLERVQPAPQAKGSTASEPAPTRSIGLSPVQQASLKDLGIQVVIPGYLPDRFSVSDVIANSCRAGAPPTGPCREGPNYTIVYRNEQNTCLVVNAIGGGVGGGASEFEFRTTSALLGEVSILFGKPSRGNQAATPEQLRALQPNLSSFPQAAKSGLGRSPFYNVVVGDADYYRRTYGCGDNTQITPLELEKIIQSLVVLE